jgi:tRNA threonylcarbamoyladenosine biosynthesis protein TsaE
MGEVELESRSAGETERLAAILAETLAPGDVVLIDGDVGTGKTTFVRGACRALGVTGTVSSPSFTIGRRYGGRVPVAHVDLFRLDSLESEDPGLLLDYLDPDSVAFVEWPKGGSATLAQRLDREPVRVGLEHLGGDRRRLRVSGPARVLAHVSEPSGRAPR